MPIDLAPYDLILRDWGSPARIRRAADGRPSSDPLEYSITVIPKTVQLTQTDTIASLQSTSRGFLAQATSLPAGFNWVECEIIWRDQTYRIVSAEDSEIGGWVYLDTIEFSPLPAT